jgi:protein-tyrosine phosphatase
LGSLINPSFFPIGLRYFASIIEGFIGIDGIDQFITKLNDIIMNSKKPTIVYLHCSAGVDRTGYVAAAYRMKYL